MILSEALVMDASSRRKTADGYLVANAAPARAGIQEYAASDFGKGNGVIRLYRPVDEVFAKDSIASYVAKPVTDDHPATFVTSTDWKDKAKGFVGNEVMRDGEKIMLPIMVADKTLIDKIEAGKAELSAGYSAKVDWTSGVTDNGEKYDGIMREIRINHVAVVDRGRAGSDCRVLDNGERKTMTTKSTVIDGIPVTLDDTAFAAVAKLQAKAESLEQSIKAKDEAASRASGEAEAKIKALTDEVGALKQKIADSEAGLDAAIEARAKVIDAAKAAIKDFDPAGKKTADIKRAVVEARLGDVAKGKNDAFIDAAFVTLSVAAKDEAKPFTAHSGVVDKAAGDEIAKARQEMIDSLNRKDARK